MAQGKERRLTNPIYRVRKSRERSVSGAHSVLRSISEGEGLAGLRVYRFTGFHYLITYISASGFMTIIDNLSEVYRPHARGRNRKRNRVSGEFGAAKWRSVQSSGLRLPHSDSGNPLNETSPQARRRIRKRCEPQPVWWRGKA